MQHHLAEALGYGTWRRTEDTAMFAAPAATAAARVS